MKSVAQILADGFDKARKDGNKIGDTTASEAVFLGISAAHLSRIKNGKAPMTDKVINQIAQSFAKDNGEYAEKLREEFKLAQKESVDEPSILSKKYSIERVGDLFDKLSNPDSLLLVDYRDFPQAVPSGSYPGLAEKAGAAIRDGLHFGMFQPFGTAESLIRKHNDLSQKIHKYPQARAFLKAYLYLYDLAMKAREFFLKVKEETTEGKGQIVLYEAQIDNPLIVASGIQSRLFLCDYFDSEHHQIRIFEWVTAIGKEDFFIERSRRSLNIDAVKLQFNPIPAFWEEHRKLPLGEDLDSAYEVYGLKKLFGEKGEIKWKAWSK